MEYIRGVYNFGKKLKSRFTGHDIGARSAQMTYYWILAFFPFLIMVTTILSYTTIAEGEFMNYLEQVLPASIMPLIQDTLNQFVEYRSATLLSFGAAASIWSSAVAVNVVTKGIHRAYNTIDTRAFWLKKINSLLYTLLLLVMVAGMIVLLVFGDKIGEYVLDALFREHAFYDLLWDLFRFSSSFIVISIGLFVIYSVVPRKYRQKNSVWPGVIFTTIGWYGFSILFSIYIENFNEYSQMYGSIGGVFILLIWLYVNGMVLLMGAEINALWQDHQVILKRKKRNK